MKTIGELIKQSKFSSEQQKASINLVYTANRLNASINSFMKKYNLTSEQFNILRILRGSHPKPLCQKDILSRMIAAQSNVTLLVRKLKAKSLIEVAQSEEDKRHYVIHITEAGLDLLSIIDQDTSFENSGVFNLSDEEAQMLNELLDKTRS